MTLEEAKVLALKILKQVMEEKLDDNNVELSQVVPSAKSKTGAQFSILNKEQLKEVIAKIETTAEGEDAATGTAAAGTSAQGQSDSTAAAQ